MRYRERGTRYVPRGGTPLGHAYVDNVYPYGDGPWTLSTTYYEPTYGEDEFSERERCWDELHPGPPWKSGGPFIKLKYTTDEHVWKHAVDIVSGKYRLTTLHRPSVSPSNLLLHSNLTEYQNSLSDLNDYGAKAWNKFKPTKPKVDLGQFIGEIKEVPKMLRATAKGFSDLWRSMGGRRRQFAPRSVANHWLNTQFGWLPFLGTLRDFYTTTKNLDSNLKQIRRDNGKWVRRGGIVNMQKDNDILIDSDTPPYPQGVTGLYRSPKHGRTLVIRRSTEKIWFSGAFRYWIPGDPDSWQWKAKAVAVLYGLRPSPSLLWELTPWTWLADWCANVGDIISNMDSITFDNLTAKYAYLMGTHTHSVTTYNDAFYSDGSDVSVSWSANYVSKRRVSASPFGFGLPEIDFSLRQWSILAALGISKFSR